METLEPGKTYIYEHVNGITYAREQGSSPATRFEVNRTYQRTEFDKQLGEEILWKDILRASKSDIALQRALENVKLIYHLSKKDGQKQTR